MVENKHEEEIKKLTSKIIELQDLIIAKEKEISSAKEERVKYFLKLSNECTDKNRKISDLENEIFEIKVLMSRQ